MRYFVYKEMDIKDYDNAYTLWEATEGMGISKADSRDNIEKFLERNPGLSYVCYRKNDDQSQTLIGTVLAGHDARRGYVYHLAVDKMHRKSGIGAKLMELCLSELKKQGIAKVHLMVYHDNEIGYRFWTNNNWVKRDEIILFSKDLV